MQELSIVGLKAGTHCSYLRAVKNDIIIFDFSMTLLNKNGLFTHRVLKGRLKMRDLKMRYGQKCKGGKCRSGKCGIRQQGWQMQE